MATTWADLLDVGDRELDPAASASAGEDEPQELPQILTPAMLIARAEGKS